MALREIRGRSLSDQVFEQLAAEILAGRYSAGQPLPAERALAETLGVNRHVIREALGRLEQLSLVRIAHGGSTLVLDYEKHAGLDLLALLAEHARAGAESARYWLAVLEMRAAIGADMARLCALRADRKLRQELVALADEMSEAESDEALYALEVRFWDRVLDGADNVTYRLALNSMLKGSRAMGTTAWQWSAHEARSSNFRRPIAEAIAKGDAAAAERATRKAMRAAVEAFEALIRKPLSPSAAVQPNTASTAPKRTQRGLQPKQK